MRQRLILFVFLVSLAGFAFVPARTSAQQSCESLTSLQIPNATVTSATAIDPPPDLSIPLPPSPIGPASNLAIANSFCRVDAFSTPTSDSHINFELWLPVAARWNGKFEAVGNGGLRQSDLDRRQSALCDGSGFRTASGQQAKTQDGHEHMKLLHQFFFL